MDKAKQFQDSKEKLIRINKIYEQTLQTGKMSKLDYDLLIAYTKEFYECIVGFEAPKKESLFNPPVEEATKIEMEDSPAVSTFQAITTNNIEVESTKNKPEIIEKVEEVKLPQTLENQALNNNYIAETPSTQATEHSIVSSKVASIFKNLDDDKEDSNINKHTQPATQEVKSIEPSNNLFESNTKKIDLNDQYGTTNAHGVARKDLLKMIGFNEKYIFLTELFNGDALSYLDTIKDINTAQSFSESLNKMEFYKQKLGWHTENEGYVYLNKLIELRFQ